MYPSACLSIFLVSTATRVFAITDLVELEIRNALELGIRKFWSLEEKQRAFASAAGLQVSPKAIS